MSYLGKVSGGAITEEEVNFVDNNKDGCRLVIKKQVNSFKLFFRLRYNIVYL